MEELIVKIADSIYKASYPNVLSLSEMLLLNEAEGKVPVLTFLDELSKQLLIKNYDRAGIRVALAIVEIGQNRDKKMVLDKLFLDLRDIIKKEK